MTYNLEEFCEDCREAISEKGDTFNIETVFKNSTRIVNVQLNCPIIDKLGRKIMQIIPRIINKIG